MIFNYKMENSQASLADFGSFAPENMFDHHLKDYLYHHKHPLNIVITHLIIPLNIISIFIWLSIFNIYTWCDDPFGHILALKGHLIPCILYLIGYICLDKHVGLISLIFIIPIYLLTNLLLYIYYYMLFFAYIMYLITLLILFLSQIYFEGKNQLIGNIIVYVPLY